MGRKKAAAPPPPATAPAKTTVKDRTDKAVDKGKGFGNNVVERAKAIGTKIKSAGPTAKAHVSRNKAAYIAGGLGAAGVATAAGIAARNRKKAAQGEN